MFKRIMPFLAVLMALTTLIIPVSATEVVASDSVDIQYPSWIEFEELCEVAPSSVSLKGIDYNLDRHLYAYSSKEVYNSGAYKGYAKLYMLAYDSNCISEFYYGSNMNWRCAESSSESNANIFVYCYDFYFNRWENVGYYPYSSRYMLVPYPQSNFLYSDFDVIATSNSDRLAIGAGDCAIDSPNWQTLTWNELGSIFPVLSSEIIGLVPIMIVFLISHLAIKKGISFILSILRQS